MGIKGKVWPQILLSPVGGETSAHYQFGVCLLKMVTLVCRNILILTARFEGTNPGFSKHFYIYNLLCSLQKSCEVGSGNATVILSVFRWEPKAWELNPSAWRDRWDLGPLLLSRVFCVSCLLATWPRARLILKLWLWSGLVVLATWSPPEQASSLLQRVYTGFLKNVSLRFSS